MDGRRISKEIKPCSKQDLCDGSCHWPVKQCRFHQSIGQAVVNYFNVHGRRISVDSGDAACGCTMAAVHRHVRMVSYLQKSEMLPQKLDGLSMNKPAQVFCSWVWRVERATRAIRLREYSKIWKRCPRDYLKMIFLRPYNRLGLGDAAIIEAGIAINRCVRIENDACRLP